MKFWKKSDKRLLSNNFCKNQSRGRRGGSRHIWRSIVFEIYGNFEVHLLSALGKELDEIEVLRNTRSHLYKTKKFKESGQYRAYMQ